MLKSLTGYPNLGLKKHMPNSSLDLHLLILWEVKEMAHLAAEARKSVKSFREFKVFG